MPDPRAGIVRDQNILLGFDFGEVRIGIAVGNRVTSSASPLRIITGNSNEAKFKQIEVIVKEWQPSTLVVGRPLHPDGNPHEMTQRCEKFARQLEGRFGIEVAMTDERYTSVTTSSDSEAAAAILQQYLQS
jgi:putative holliday junction resolvase